MSDAPGVEEKEQAEGSPEVVDEALEQDDGAAHAEE
jgi:hypothetical protein